MFAGVTTVYWDLKLYDQTFFATEALFNGMKSTHDLVNCYYCIILEPYFIRAIHAVRVRAPTCLLQPSFTVTQGVPRRPARTSGG